MKAWRFCSIALLSCSTSMLFAFLARMFVDLAIPILIIRIIAILVICYLVYDARPDQNSTVEEKKVSLKAVFGLIAGGLILGWIIGYYDEFEIVFTYQFTEIILLPLTIGTVLLVLGILNYAKFQAKN
jgi:hypothetical protein